MHFFHDSLKTFYTKVVQKGLAPVRATQLRSNMCGLSTTAKPKLFYGSNDRFSCIEYGFVKYLVGFATVFACEGYGEHGNLLSYMQLLTAKHLHAYRRLKTVLNSCSNAYLRLCNTATPSYAWNFAGDPAKFNAQGRASTGAREAKKPVAPLVPSRRSLPLEHLNAPAQAQHSTANMRLATARYAPCDTHKSKKKTDLANR